MRIGHLKMPERRNLQANQEKTRRQHFQWRRRLQGTAFWGCSTGFCGHAVLNCRENTCGYAEAERGSGCGDQHVETHCWKSWRPWRKLDEKQNLVSGVMTSWNMSKRIYLFQGLSSRILRIISGIRLRFLPRSLKRETYEGEFYWLQKKLRVEQAKIFLSRKL